MAYALSGLSMEDQVRRINSEYGFNLSEDEIQTIARRAEEFERLFRCLYEVDLTDTVPLLKLDKRV
jgi:cytidylate kinase